MRELVQRLAGACPSCPSARSARALALDEGFWTNLFVVSLPLLVLGLIGALLYRIDAGPLADTPAPRSEEEVDE